ARRVVEVLDTAPSMAEAMDPSPLPADAADAEQAAVAMTTGAEPAAGSADHGVSVEFRDATFAYPRADAPVLDGVSFTPPAGKPAAVIGSTGSGTSTLTTMVPRL